MDLKPPLIGDSFHPSVKISDSSTSAQPTVSPDPRWPSKCRWSIESSSPTTSTPCTVSTEKEISADTKLVSTPPVPIVKDGKAEISYQLDVVDLVPNPMDSDETLTQKLGEIDSSGIDASVATDDSVTLPEIVHQTEEKAAADSITRSHRNDEPKSHRSKSLDHIWAKSTRRRSDLPNSIDKTDFPDPSGSNPGASGRDREYGGNSRR
ncbi:hypothetical protein Bca52824_032714 [Brassica carinata]|uniref:Uncharacterized protein n=1 Tax=Brassica carinata TaxID=52824 RepID=A0A8X7SD54_BRACI|nr:hypothetical protein Bca52824_032714 [Brassica carinata]